MNNKPQIILHKKHSQREVGLPLVRGPFRGIIITFHKNTDLVKFQETHASMTFLHPNFYKNVNDKHKSIIYYKNPYDAALVLDKYSNNDNFYASLYYDFLSKTLHPEILYINTNTESDLEAKITLLNGTIIKQTKAGIQVKFENFKKAAIAHEELKTEFKIKFTYKSEVPIENIRNQEKGNQTSSNIAQTPIVPKVSAQKTIEKDILDLVKKYQGILPKLKDEFCLAMEIIDTENRESNLRKIKNAAKNLDLANISWNAQILLEETEENDDEPLPNETQGMVKLRRLFDDMKKRE